MKRTHGWFTVVFLLVLVFSPGLSAGQGTAVVVFEGVTLIPMDRERFLPNRSVVVRDGRIAEIAAADRLSLPTGAVRVDGRGKFLIPALAEMHAHIPAGDASDQEIARVLFMYVANGIGTIRGMLGDPRHLPLRDRAARGELISPRIYTSGPSFRGASAPTLVLLEANPLQDIANTSKIAGVMIGGRWLPKSEIERRLNDRS